MPEIQPQKQLRVIRVHPDHPSPDTIHRAAEIIKDQGVVVFPTQCLYGMAADARDPAAIKKIFHIKKRPENNPLLVLVHSMADLENMVARIPDAAQKLMQAFWPGSLTLVFEARSDISDLLTAGTGKIGIRIPAHPVARALVKAAGRPVTGTSANLSGTPGCSCIQALPHELIQSVDLVLDAGHLQGGSGSTVLDITCNPFRVFREGRIPSSTIHQMLAS
ncbi:MAG: L-threonylcarbamoyladenylate synthase [Desulfotignum sp.]|nr:L-threonylcarbamoyladenylate synthase [Desulfotignum sp.]